AQTSGASRYRPARGSLRNRSCSCAHGYRATARSRGRDPPASSEDFRRDPARIGAEHWGGRDIDLAGYRATSEHLVPFTRAKLPGSGAGSLTVYVVPNLHPTSPGISDRGVWGTALAEGAHCSRSGGEARTLNLMINSHLLCRLSYPGIS